jgi:cyanophycinase-like exopeptidase
MAARPKPVLLIAGGRGSERGRGPDPLIQEAIRQAGITQPSVAYVGAASGDNPVFRGFIARLLQKAGAGEVRLAPLCGKRGDAAKARRVLESSHIVFMSGGDVDEGMEVLRRADVIDFLHALYKKGVPFFGVSAGSIMLAKKWVRWRDPGDESTVELFPCLGFARVLCDTHGEVEGWEELKTLQSLSPASEICYGIQSGAAIRVDPDGTVAALGKEVHRFTRRGGKVLQIESLAPLT